MPSTDALRAGAALTDSHDWEATLQRLSSQLERSDPSRPVDAESRQRILRERAARLARPVDVHNGTLTLSLIGIRCADRVFGVSIAQAESVAEETLRKVPGLGDMHAGIVSHRGSIVAVIDVGLLLGYAPSTWRVDARVLVVAAGGRRLGLLADDVLGIRVFSETDLSPQYGGGELESHSAALGLAGNWIVLDIAGLVRDTRLVVDEEGSVGGAWRRKA